MMKPMASLLPLTSSSKPTSIKSLSNPTIILISASLIIILICSMKMSMAYLLTPQTPTIQLNNLHVSNFRVSNSDMAAIWLANFTIHNPNMALAIRMNQIEASILYKYDSVVWLTSVKDLKLSSWERKEVYVKFVTTGNERDDQPIVEYPLLREIEKEKRGGEVRFRMRLNAMTWYEIDWRLSWRRTSTSRSTSTSTRPVVMINVPYNMDWDVHVRDGSAETIASW